MIESSSLSPAPGSP